MTEPLYRVIVEGFKGIFAVLGMKLDIVGEGNIPLQGGAVLALNHTSYLDFALGGVPADRRGRRFVRFMAKDSVFRHPITGPLMRGMKHIPVDRHDGSVAFDTAVAAEGLASDERFSASAGGKCLAVRLEMRPVPSCLGAHSTMDEDTAVDG